MSNIIKRGVKPLALAVGSVKETEAKKGSDHGDQAG